MKCKKCGNTDFAYVEARKNKIRLRWKLLFILISLISISIVGTYENETLKIVFGHIGYLSFLTFIATLIIDKIRRRQTHTKTICKNCQTIKWIN